MSCSSKRVLAPAPRDAVTINPHLALQRARVMLTELFHILDRIADLADELADVLEDPASPTAGSDEDIVDIDPLLSTEDHSLSGTASSQNSDTPRPSPQTSVQPESHRSSSTISTPYLTQTEPTPHRYTSPMDMTNIPSSMDDTAFSRFRGLLTSLSPLPPNPSRSLSSHRTTTTLPVQETTSQSSRVRTVN